MIKVVQLGIQ